MKQTRSTWIDIARGIGIMLVVYGHALSADSLRFIIYSFHMPFFFFLSGLLFTHRPEQKFRSFFYKNVKGLLYPYFLFAFLSFVLWLVTKDVPSSMAVRQFWSIFYGNGSNNLLAFNNLLWFLPSLFITRIGFFPLVKITMRRKLLFLLLFLFSLIGYSFSVLFPKAKLWFGAETALTAIVFFGAGYLLKISGEKLKEIARKYAFLILFITLSLGILFAVLNFQAYGLQVDLRQNRLNNYFYFYLAAFAGTISMCMLSILIRTNRWLEYLGKNSLVIFVWHLIMFSYISKLLTLMQLNRILAELPAFVSPILYSLASIILILFITAGFRGLFRLAKRERAYFM